MALKSKDVLSSAVETIIEKIAEAIKEFEGYYPGSRSYRNNNPGNLRNVQGLAGQIGLDETGHIIFDSFESGWNALKRQIRLVFSGQSHVYTLDDSLLSFFSKYAEANQGPYAAYVAGRLGVNPNTTFRELGAL